MKVVYIAHPIGGDVKNNLEKIKNIVRDINLTKKNVVPFAPYWLDCHALNDNVLKERKRGIKNNIVLLRRSFVDELWLFGDKISQGMIKEIEICRELNIKVAPKSPETLEHYKILFDYEKHTQ